MCSCHSHECTKQIFKLSTWPPVWQYHACMETRSSERGLYSGLNHFSPVWVTSQATNSSLTASLYGLTMEYPLSQLYLALHKSACQNILLAGTRIITLGIKIFWTCLMNYLVPHSCEISVPHWLSLQGGERSIIQHLLRYTVDILFFWVPRQALLDTY